MAGATAIKPITGVCVHYLEYTIFILVVTHQVLYRCSDETLSSTSELALVRFLFSQLGQLKHQPGLDTTRDVIVRSLVLLRQSMLFSTYAIDDANSVLRSGLRHG